MSFACPVSDQRLVLNHVVRIAELAKTNRFAEATPETVDAVLEAAAEYAQGELGYKTDMSYRLLNRDVRGKWDFVTRPTRQG